MKKEEEKLSQIYIRYDRLRDKLVLVQYYGEEAVMSRVELRMVDSAAVVHAIQTLLKERFSLMDRETVNEEILKFIFRRGPKGLPREEYERVAAAAIGVSDWVVHRWVDEIIDGQPIPEVLLQLINVKQVQNDLYYRELRAEKVVEGVSYDELTVQDFILLEEEDDGQDCGSDAVSDDEICRQETPEQPARIPDNPAKPSREIPGFYSSSVFD